MLTARQDRKKEIQKQPAGKPNRPENAKKFKNRGNELKDLLQTQDLASFWSKKRTQNELNFVPKKGKTERKKRLLGAFRFTAL
jgi:hypothetical protein